ncbi:acyl carrier protein [Streptomyces phyllanthi]|uniref:Acyl carrier protein n=1 Tax=Streptomyces phyllanthi TaxID=1803180 RepID=A0A5N8VXZ4_9ACTN|nr:acyl carrier protein [Streptomyces phyllanthi]MPY38964.1 acyl carrier protein [Streptomyces phyllanthi]
MKPETYSTVCDLIRKHSQALAGRDIEQSETLSDLGIDSLEQLSLVVDVENCFDVSIDDEELAEVRTVKDLAELVDRHRGKG